MVDTPSRSELCGTQFSSFESRLRICHESKSCAGHIRRRASNSPQRRPQLTLNDARLVPDAQSPLKGIRDFGVREVRQKYGGPCCITVPAMADVDGDGLCGGARPGRMVGGWRRSVESNPRFVRSTIKGRHNLCFLRMTLTDHLAALFPVRRRHRLGHRHQDGSAQVLRA